jgi:predicted phosphodiesterase
MKTIFLSDIHMGVDAPTNTYQTSKHQPMLKAILRYIEENGDSIQDVVILGDWFDLWLYTTKSVPKADLPAEGDRSNFLPTVEQIIKANKGVFVEGTTGDFISCLKAIKGKIRYINGNHDMNVTGDEVNKCLKELNIGLKEEIAWESCLTDDVGYNSPNRKIYAEHGHWYSLLCSPKYKRKVTLKDSDIDVTPLPLGYFVTRAEADLKSPESLTVKAIKNKMDTTFKNQTCKFSKAVLDIIASGDNNESPVKKDINNLCFNMPNSERIPAMDVASFFPFPEDTVYNEDFLFVDLKNNLDGSAKSLFNNEDKKDLKLVLFGHTHDARVIQDFSTLQNLSDSPEYLSCRASQDLQTISTAYVNTGFLCIPNFSVTGKGLPTVTFVEVESFTEDSLPFKVSTYSVNSKTHKKSENPICSINIFDNKLIG